MSHFYSSEVTPLRMGDATIRGVICSQNLENLQIAGAQSSRLTVTMWLGALLACGTLKYTDYYVAHQLM